MDTKNLEKKSKLLSIAELFAEVREEELHAVLPEYYQGANVTRTLWSDGQERIIKRRMIYFIAHLKSLSSYNVDLLKNKQEHFFQSNVLLPIPLSRKLILVPVRVRKPIAKSDGAYGYLSIDGIEKIEVAEKTPEYAAVMLKGQNNLLATRTKYKQLNQQVAVTRSIRSNYFNFEK